MKNKNNKENRTKKKRTQEKMRPSVQLIFFNTVFDEFNLQRS